MRAARNLKIGVGLVCGLVAFVIMANLFVPVSTTYLMDDVGGVVYSSEYRAEFMRMAKDNIVSDTTVDLTDYGAIRDKIVQVALAEVGTYEQGGNTNKIKYNDWYQPMHTWLTGRDEYCAIFTIWCMNEVGMYVTNSKGPPAIDNAACTGMSDLYMKYDRFVYATSNYTPRPGDLIFFTKWVPYKNSVGYKSNHVGLVVSCDGEYVYTVEGNTSIPEDDFQAAGNGVYTKKHALPSKDPNSKILGFGIPWYEGDEEFSAPGGELY